MLLIIGSNGFIGRHLTARAADSGIPLTVVSRTFEQHFFSRYAPAARKVPASEVGSESFNRLLKKASAVVYLVSHSVPVTTVTEPVNEVRHNVEPAFSFFLQLAEINPGARLVYLSSGGTVYGRTQVLKIPETHPLHPVSPYGLGKCLCESCIRFCADTRGQRYAILRVSNPVGRWHSNPHQGLVPTVLRAITANVPLPVFGDGQFVRDYLDADDLADAILRVALNATRNDTWNIGSGIGHTTLDVVDIVSNVVGRKPALKFLPARPFDVERNVLSIEQITRDFGWKPMTTLSESVKRIVAKT
ncbi:MAG TPA: NAD-dependent epimerase/dehydratase family protein [Methylocella sp.]|nr:NAD-dependent epimerase/dehydratase family protein [Methylocella sp.]